MNLEILKKKTKTRERTAGWKTKKDMFYEEKEI